MNWQPIETAPKHEDNPILTEEGFVVFKRIGYLRSVHETWCICDSSGQCIVCADEGYLSCSPRWWMPIPPHP